MNTIKIIDVLHLDSDGVKAKMKNGRFQTIHLRQGDLDGACAVYSTMMILILIGAVKYKDIKIFGNNYDKRYSVERLKKEMFEKKGLHREGNHFFHNQYDNIKDMLKRSYSKIVITEHVDYTENNVVNVIENQISNNNPVLISIAFKGGAHALVAVGVEYNQQNTPTKILCLDPAYATPKFTYWNSVVDLKEYKGKYNYRNITETGLCQFVQLQDALIISKK